MMAALTAAELLATGNGRCNLTNTGAVPANYHGENPGFADFALESFSPQDALEYFLSLGLVTVTEYGGRVYPLSNAPPQGCPPQWRRRERGPAGGRCGCRPAPSVRERRRASPVLPRSAR